MVNSDHTAKMLREKQQRVILKALNRNQDVEDVQSARLDWKTLIYDDRALWILTVLFKVASMSDVGITSLELISKKRAAISSVDAIYLVEPTEENLSRIASDCGEGIYDSVYINFLSSISKPMLEQFAGFVARKCDGHCIRSVFDQYVNFCAIDPNVFVLQEQDNFLHDIFGFTVQEAAFESACRSIGESLADVFLTTGEIPRIVYKQGAVASRYVIRYLCDKLNPMSSNLEFMGSRRGSTSTKQPLLIVFDRTVDLAGALHHHNSYEALVHDLYGISRNQCQVGGKSYDLDPDLDPFWNEHRTKQFGDVVLANAANVKRFQAEYGAIDKDLGAALANLTELQHKQRSLSTHTKIADDMVKVIKFRKGDDLFRLEEDCFLQKDIDIETIVNTLREVPEQIDKLRFVTIAFLCGIIDKSHFDRLSSVVGCSLSFLSHSFEQFKIRTKSREHVLGKLWSRIAGQHDDNAVASSLPVPTMVKSILDGELEGFCDQNEKQLYQLHDFDKVYVFIVGPGSYVEYNGLMYAAESLNVNVTYGCTSIPRPSEMMTQMMRFGD